RLMGGRLGATLRLPHAAEDHAGVAHDRCVPDVQRAETDVLVRREAQHADSRGAEQGDNLLVLGRPPGHPGPRGVTHAAPLRIPPAAAPFELEEATIADLQAGMTAGKYTARSLVAAYLQRIEALDRKGPALRSVLEPNPDALAQATALDAERKAKGPRGPLHGIPILVKDNVATRDRMQSTAGSLALVGVSPPRDAFLVERLRAAGAALLGKTNLSEWANF